MTSSSGDKGTPAPEDRFEPASSHTFFKRRLEERPEPAPGLAPGRVVSDYRLLYLIGQGGMGQVWEAEQISLGDRKVAVKFVGTERVEPKQLDFFQREARAAARLNHPGIVSIHGYGEDAGMAWIAMEYVEGAWTLRDFIDEASWEPIVHEQYDREVARLVAQIADAVQAAHEAGVIHRDLKPQNVLVTPENRPKVTDFGLAKITDEPALSQTGEFAGTYFYMSPEQVAARRMGIDHRTDVFSLGVMLYEMLALRRPFQGDTTHQVAAQILTREPPDLRTIRSRIPDDLVVIAGKALEKDPERRYATMADLAADLRRHLESQPIEARPPTPAQRALKWTKRHPTASGIGAVAAAAFAIIAGLFVKIVGTNRALERSNTALEERTFDLEQANVALVAKTAEAEVQRNEALARRDEVLRLSALQDLANLLAAADLPAVMWPPHPDRIDSYRAWIVRAQALTADAERHHSVLTELRALAIPRTEEERRRERATHPERPRLDELEARIRAVDQALARRHSGADSPLPDVSGPDYPVEATPLNGMAWPLVDPERDTFGQEPLGLALALLALERAPAAERAMIGDTVAWAYFSLGRDDDALAASAAALDAAPTAREAEFREYCARLEQAVSRAASPAGRAAAERERVRLRAAHDALDRALDERREWRFPEDRQDLRWWNGELTKLVNGLDALTDPETGLLATDAISPEHGWSVPKRLAHAERLRVQFAPGGAFAERWEDALPLLRSSLPDLALGPQMGLVPIGRDPASGQWEFWHVASGSEPPRDADGGLAPTEESGIVLALIPGGSFRMGADADDPAAESDERPAHAVALSPFFLSKYEVTQAQWLRLTGRNPSFYQRTGMAPSLLHPVEQLSWHDCMLELPRTGLGLPSEAQWEYACRAGTDTTWWTGSERESLSDLGAANLADQSAIRSGATWPQARDWPELDDGYPVHAAVGSTAPNPFGLHEMYGNLWEWCLDGYDEAFYARGPESDPVAPSEDREFRVRRGGSFFSTAAFSRSSSRDRTSPGLTNSHFGVRPARPLVPAPSGPAGVRVEPAGAPRDE